MRSKLISQIFPISKTTPRKDSLTDQILKFCASGQFGVREAIAAAKIEKIEKINEEEMEERRVHAQERTPAEPDRTVA